LSSEPDEIAQDRPTGEDVQSGSLFFDLKQGEHVLWQGRLEFPRFVKISIVIALVILAVFHLGALAGPLPDEPGLDIYAAGPILVGLIFWRLFGRSQLYVTNQRIVRATDWYLVKTSFEFPLSSLVDVDTKHARARANLGYLVFKPSEGYKPIFFGPFKGKPEDVREIALKAHSTSVHQ
jgi:hypothetical protein